MMRRVLIAGLAAAAMYAAVLGTAAPAQAPTPEPTVEATPEPITSPAPTATSEPAETPSPAPSADPADDATPTPFPSPAETTTPAPPATDATPAPTGTPDATATATATATPGHKPRRRNSKVGVGNVNSCEGQAGKNSPSTSARECEALRDEQHNPVLAPTPTLTNPDGSPAPTNPGYSLAVPGAARVGVPNFFIDKFRIPPFLLPIYQAAGMQYGVRWEVLAAINEIETDYGRNLNVSSAGALGWMQFMPPTWAPTASTPTATASRTPSTRSTRSSPPRATCAPPAPTQTSAAPSSPTTTPTGTSTRC